MKKEKYEISDKKNGGLSFVISLFAIFTLLIAGPINLYLSNINDLWFSFWDLTLIILAWSAIAALVLFAVCKFTKGKAKEIILCLIFAFGLGFFLQGNFMNINYGLLNGQKINWSDYTVWALINTIIWVIIIALPLVLYFLKKEIWSKIVKFVSTMLLILQFMLLIIMFITTPLKTSGMNYFSAKDQFVLSKKQNTIVFILDTFDKRYFDEIQGNDPEFFDALDGFTYFSDSIGSYPTTLGAIPFILTGKYYYNEHPYNNYIDDAFKNTNFYLDLQSNNYDTRVFSAMTFANNNAKGIDNVKYSRKMVSSYFGLAKLLGKFTAFRFFPHITKPIFWFYSGDFDKYYKTSDKANPIYKLDDFEFNEKLKKESLSVVDDKNSLRIYHLYGAHPPYIMNENVQKVKTNKSSSLRQSKGCMNIVFNYLEKMKEKGIYDNSTVIIMADHGYTDCNISSQPILIIKRPNEAGPLKYSKAQISHADLQATILDCAGLPYSEYGDSVFDKIENKSYERKYMIYKWTGGLDNNYLPSIKEYRINGPLIDGDSITFTGNNYYNNSVSSKSNKIQLNEIINVDNEIINNYFIEGFSDVEKNDNETFKWTTGKNSTVMVKLDKVPVDGVTVKLGVAGVFNNKQLIKIKAFNTLVWNSIIENKNGEITFTIPAKYFSTKNELILNIGFPDAISPLKLKMGSDIRELCLKVKYLLIQNN